MNEIDSLGASFFYAGTQNSTSEAAKEKRKERISSTRKSAFSQILKSQSDEETFSLKGLPPEIATLNIEEAAVYLKDKVDLAGKDLSENINSENLAKFKESIAQFINFMIQNNFEVAKKNRKGFSSPANYFSNYNTQPRPKDPRVQVQVINQKLDEMTRDMLYMQSNNLKILKQIEEIKGLIVDLMSS